MNHRRAIFMIVRLEVEEFPQVGIDIVNGAIEGHYCNPPAGDRVAALDTAEEKMGEFPVLLGPGRMVARFRLHG